MPETPWINALQQWRENDQEDKIVLTRAEVIGLLNEIENIHEYCI